MPKDLHELPKLRESISYLYFEHAIIEQNDSSILVIREDGQIPVPVSSVTCLLLGPGTRANLPHARGDEPCPITSLRWNVVICPTHVGMNRI